MNPKDRLNKILDDMGGIPDNVSVPIPKSMYNEFVLRMGEDVDVAGMIANVVWDFLERTTGHDPPWSYEHAMEVADEAAVELREKLGPAHRGYMWKKVLLLNGTQIRMTYDGKDFFSEIKHGKLIYEGQFYSPSQWASKIASGTSRNAWLCLYLKFPDSDSWELAQTVRDRKRGGRMNA